MNITRDDTLCMVIDFQEKLMPVINNRKDIVENSKRLLLSLKEMSIPVILTQQYKKGLGETISKISDIIAEIPMEKNTFSSLKTHEIFQKIKESNKKNIILIGCEAHVCVLQTLIDLQENGYQTFLLADCVGSRKEYDKEYALKRASALGSVITTYEAVVFELLEEGNTDLFRRVLKIID